jgi:tetratricopeptide (TPR) repeat protein
MPTPSLSDYQQAIVAHMNRQDWASAATTAASCRSAWPNDRTGWLLGSFVALLADNKDAALALMDERLRHDPADLQCLIQQAECLLALGRAGDALAAAERAVPSAQAIPDALDAIASFLVHANAPSRARELYDDALGLAPNRTDLLGKRAMVSRFLGDFKAAERDYDALLAIEPANASALKERAELSRQSLEHNTIPAMERSLARSEPDSKDAATLHFGLAKSFEDTGDYSSSWHHLSRGNAIERALIQYDVRTDCDLMQRLRVTLTAPQKHQLTTANAGPIFILGLPRSGTTLVERILGSHSRIYPAGELPALSEALTAIMVKTSGLERFTREQYISALPTFTPEKIRDEYLSRAQSRRGDKDFFTDKQPTNFFYCPLIAQAFPDARIIHLTRHPLAACYAIYKIRFQGTYPFAYDLRELGDFYIGYAKLMAHWHSILPHRIHDLSYEALVARPADTIRALFEYVGLPLEDACLNFHANPTATTTASAIQVRQPLYDSSVHQWKNYASELAELKRQLDLAGIKIP